jgi:hypothetical protein
MHEAPRPSVFGGRGEIRIVFGQSPFQVGRRAGIESAGASALQHVNVEHRHGGEP